MERKVKKIGWKRIPDPLWEKIKVLLPKYKKSPKGGRPRKDIRSVFDGIFFVLRTGCQWKMIPQEFPSGSTCHLYFQNMVKAGVFEKIWKIALKEYDLKKGIKWKWQSGDSHTVSSPEKGGRLAKTPPTGVKTAVKGTF